MQHSLLKLIEALKQMFIACGKAGVSNIRHTGWIWPIEPLYQAHQATGQPLEVGESGQWGMAFCRIWAP